MWNELNGVVNGQRGMRRQLVCVRSCVRSEALSIYVPVRSGRSSSNVSIGQVMAISLVDVMTVASGSHVVDWAMHYNKHVVDALAP